MKIFRTSFSNRCPRPCLLLLLFALGAVEAFITPEVQIEDGLDGPVRSLLSDGASALFGVATQESDALGRALGLSTDDAKPAKSARQLMIVPDCSNSTRILGCIAGDFKQIIKEKAIIWGYTNATFNPDSGNKVPTIDISSITLGSKAFNLKVSVENIAKLKAPVRYVAFISLKLANAFQTSHQFSFNTIDKSWESALNEEITRVSGSMLEDLQYSGLPRPLDFILGIVVTAIKTGLNCKPLLDHTKLLRKGNLYFKRLELANCMQASFSLNKEGDDFARFLISCDGKRLIMKVPLVGDDEHMINVGEKLKQQLEKWNKDNGAPNLATKNIPEIFKAIFDPKKKDQGFEKLACFTENLEDENFSENSSINKTNLPYLRLRYIGDHEKVACKNEPKVKMVTPDALEVYGAKMQLGWMNYGIYVMDDDFQETEFLVDLNGDVPALLKQEVKDFRDDDEISLAAGQDTTSTENLDVLNKYFNGKKELKLECVKKNQIGYKNADIGKKSVEAKKEDAGPAMRLTCSRNGSLFLTVNEAKDEQGSKLFRFNFHLPGTLKAQKFNIGKNSLTSEITIRQYNSYDQLAKINSNIMSLGALVDPVKR